MCVRARRHVRERKESKRPDRWRDRQKERDDEVLCWCMWVCLRICFQRAQASISQDHLVEKVIFASLLFMGTR